MWDSNAPLQLLKSMPNKLSKENLEKIQLLLDADKYKNSLVSGFDLCGMYAPFCRGCQKTSIYPCAIAYINMMRAKGMDVEIDAKPVTGGAGSVIESAPSAEKPQRAAQKVMEEIAVTAPVQEEPKEEPKVVEKVVETPLVKEITEVKEVEKVEEKPVEAPQPLNEPQKREKRKIRIAVARKKI